MKRKKTHYFDWDIITLIPMLILVAASCLIAMAPAINKAIDRREVVVTVMDKGIKNDRNKSRYLIYCENSGGDTEVYEISDSLFRMRFDSSDVYPNILPGKDYRLDVCGKRVPLLSWYPNIYGYEEINADPE